MTVIRAGLTLAAGIVSLGISAAAAQTLTEAAVEPLLYPVGEAEVEILPNKALSEKEAAILSQVGAAQPYYGAIAISPDEGLMSEATVAAANHHTIEAAKVAALAACNEKRKGKADCVLVGLIRPKGWTERPFQLSSSATEDFDKTYKKIRRDKAFAISPSTGTWGVGKGKDAAAKAIEECTKKPAPVAPTDCIVVIAD